MSRARATFPLLLGILLGSSLPILFVVQAVRDKGLDEQVWVDAELTVRVEGHEALVYTAELTEVEPSPLIIGASSMLRQAEFPWDPTPFEASFRLRLDERLLREGTAGEHPDGWSASWTERLVTRPDGLGLPPIPCEGLIVVKNVTLADPDAVGIARLEQLDLALDIRCTSAGADLVWHSGDERTWTIEGPATLVRGKR